MRPPMIYGSVYNTGVIVGAAFFLHVDSEITPPPLPK